MQNIYLIYIISCLILLGFLVTFVASLIVLIIYYLPNMESLPRIKYNRANNEITLSNTYVNILYLANSVRKLNSGVLLEFIWTLFPLYITFYYSYPIIFSLIFYG